MSPLSILSIFLILGIVQGLFLVFSLKFIKDGNYVANKFLSVFILLISLTMLGRLIIETNIYSSFPNFFALPDAIIFLYGPFLYFYIQHLLFVKESAKKKDILNHFLPAVLFIISELPVFLPDANQFKIIFLEYQPIRYFFVEGLALIVNGYYLYLVHRLTTEYKLESGELLSIPSLPRYLLIIKSIILITLIFWFVSYFSWLIIDMSFFTSYGYNIVWIILPLLIYVVGYFALNQPELFRVSGIVKSANKQELNINFEEWRNKLEAYIQSNKSYLNPTLTLNELAMDVGLKPYQLSKLINSQFEKNFNDYINQFRINEFKQRVKNEDLKKTTILAIAFDSGFNSKTTFNTSFKKLTNQTPNQFIKAIK